jgi:putative transposase
VGHPLRVRGPNGEKSKPRIGTCEGERKAESENWRAHDDGRSPKKNGSLETAAKRRHFVDHHGEEFGSVREACKAAGISSSTYYYKPKRDPVGKAAADADVRDLIEKVQAEFAFYGYRRIHEWLERKRGITINEKKIIRVMKEYGLKALIWRGFKVKTTDSDHPYGYAPNLLPGMSLNRVNQVWVADITYIRILTGFVYLAVIMDLFSRKVVGWAISLKIDAALCLEALNAAIEDRKPPPGLVHHADRGVQYACREYNDKLAAHGIVASMSAKGYCYDNAFMETWFKTLKAEEVYLTEYETIEDVLKAVPRFIEAVYNEKRIHSSLNYFSPEEFEELAANGLLAKHGINPVMQLPGKPSN